MTDHGWAGQERRPLRSERRLSTSVAPGDFDFEPTAEPMRLEATDLGAREARAERPAAAEERYYAVMAQPGHLSGTRVVSPKLVVLYVTADGHRALKRYHRGIETESGDVVPRSPVPPVTVREEGTGAAVPASHAAAYADRVEELHDPDDVEVEDGGHRERVQNDDDRPVATDGAGPEEGQR